jgi:hypothetical protein
MINTIILVFLFITILLYIIYKVIIDSIIKSSIIIGYECDRDKGVIEDVTTRYNLYKGLEIDFNIQGLKDAYIVFNVLGLICIILIIIYYNIFVLQDKLTNEQTFILILLCIYFILYIAILTSNYKMDLYEKYKTLLKDKYDKSKFMNILQKNAMEFYKTLLKDKYDKKDFYDYEINGDVILDTRHKNYDYNDNINDKDTFNIIRYTKIDLNDHSNASTKILDDVKNNVYGFKMFGNARGFDLLWFLIVIMIIYLLGFSLNYNELIPIYIIIAIIVILVFIMIYYKIIR